MVAVAGGPPGLSRSALWCTGSSEAWRLQRRNHRVGLGVLANEVLKASLISQRPVGLEGILPGVPGVALGAPRRRPRSTLSCHSVPRWGFFHAATRSNFGCGRAKSRLRVRPMAPPSCCPQLTLKRSAPSPFAACIRPAPVDLATSRSIDFFRLRGRIRQQARIGGW